MFSRKKGNKDRKEEKRKPRSKGNVLPGFEEYGVSTSTIDDADLEAELRSITGVPYMEEENLNFDENDSDLEAELNALMGGAYTKKPRPRAKEQSKHVMSAPIEKLDIEKLGNISDTDDVSEDENDPELLSELLELTTEKVEEQQKPSEKLEPITVDERRNEPDILTTLTERLQMYKEAVAKAKSNNESARARRFDRGIKTLENLIKAARSGKDVDVNDVPPVIALNLKPVINTEPLKNEDNSSVPSLNTDDLSPPAVNALSSSNLNVISPSSENLTTDLSNFLVPDNEDPVAEGNDSENNHTLGISKAFTNIPVPEKQLSIKRGIKSIDIHNDDRCTVNESNNNKNSSNNEILAQLIEIRNKHKSSAILAKKSGDIETALKQVKLVKELDILIAKAGRGEVVNLNDVPTINPAKPLKENSVKYEVPIPATVLEALEQRLKKYLSLQKLAEKQGSEPRAKRNAKVVKQYKEAIALHKAGKKIPDNLPIPPGYPPIPLTFQF